MSLYLSYVPPITEFMTLPDLSAKNKAAPAMQGRLVEIPGALIGYRIMLDECSRLPRTLLPMVDTK